MWVVQISPSWWLFLGGASSESCFILAGPAMNILLQCNVNAGQGDHLQPNALKLHLRKWKTYWQKHSLYFFFFKKKRSFPIKYRKTENDSKEEEHLRPSVQQCSELNPLLTQLLHPWDVVKGVVAVLQYGPSQVSPHRVQAPTSTDLFHEFVQPCHVLVLSSSLPSDGTCNHRLTEQIRYAHWRTSSSLEGKVRLCPFQERVSEFEVLYCAQHKQREGLAQLPTQIHSSSSWHTLVVLSGRRESRSG